jgi:hypothetical protein
MRRVKLRLLHAAARLALLLVHSALCCAMLPPSDIWPSLTISVLAGSPSPTVKPCTFPASRYPKPRNQPHAPRYNEPRDESEEDEHPEESTRTASGNEDGCNGTGSDPLTELILVTNSANLNDIVECYGSGQSCNDAKLQ